MLILGIDPGSRVTGYGLIEKDGDRLTAIEHGRFTCAVELPVAERLYRLRRDLEALIERTSPDAVAFESPFHGLNSRSLIVLAQARGALLSAIDARSVRVEEYSPAEVKSAVSGNGRADKQQVAAMVRLILKVRGRASADATDALAVAVCCAQRCRFEQLTRGS